MTEHEIVIAGGGPTGLMLAAELGLAGVDVAIVERRATQERKGSRAGGLHARTIEILDQRGIADRFIAEGTKYPVCGFALIQLDISDFPTRHNYVLALWQIHTERILADWIGELNVPIYRGLDVTGFKQDDEGVDVDISDGRSLRAQYLVGCDGGRSLIRKTAGIEFPGWDPTTSWLMAEAEVTEDPPFGFRENAFGRHAIGKAEGNAVGIVLMEAQVEHDKDATLQDVSEALIAVYGSDFGIHNPNWISRFTDMTRQASTYRDRRVLLAGDAAHVHPPMGGQGLNMGVQDAMNLGWKLARVIKRTAPDSLLDTYHAERHPVAARVLQNTMAATALTRTDDRTKALGNMIGDFLKMVEPRKRTAGEISGLDIHYDLGEGHPLVGRRMPDLDIVTPDGTVRVFTLLHDAKPVLINFGEPRAFDTSHWPDVKLIDAKYEGTWELPVVGEVPAPSAVLIRPDGYVAQTFNDPRNPRAA